MTAGTLIFRAVVLEPALRSEQDQFGPGRQSADTNLALAWIGLAITVVSGVIWFWFKQRR